MKNPFKKKHNFKYLYRLSGVIHDGVETSGWSPTDINRGNTYPWETKLAHPINQPRDSHGRYTRKDNK